MKKSFAEDCLAAALITAACIPVQSKVILRKAWEKPAPTEPTATTNELALLLDASLVRIYEHSSFGDFDAWPCARTIERLRAAAILRKAYYYGSVKPAPFSCACRGWTARRWCSTRCAWATASWPGRGRWVTGARTRASPNGVTNR